jgi:asparagine synthase (glutamine-hydrolysing)
MCGIAGALGPNGREAVRSMMDALAHRGPDGEGEFHEDGVCLGHRRLSIVDLEGGRQPIANETETLQLVCNGEIYNYPELRPRLEARGHTFRTGSDVEVILHLYEEHGTDCVRHLRGMFAFALWDRERRRLLLARDHMGQKPLFFWEDDGRFVFASEVKGVLASGRVAPKLDLDALWHYISLRFIPDDRSLFGGIRKLEAGTILVHEGGRTTTERYWSPHFTPKLTGTVGDVEEALDQLLLETVRLHLLSDVPVGAFLSGGIDSSTVAAMMATVTGGPVPVFSIGVKEQGFNELPYARMVVDRYGMEAHERVVQADLIHLIPAMVHHLDEPSDPFGVGVYLVSQVASESVKVVLGGDGGDENFAGYDRYAGQRLVDYYCLLPAAFRRTVMKRLIDRVPESFGYKSLAQKAAWVHEMAQFDRGRRYAHSMSFLRFTPEAKESLFTPAAKARVKDADSVAKILRFFDAADSDELVDRMLYTDLMTRMPDHLLPIVDRMSMAHSLETRAPLVDHKLVEFAASIPAGMKLHGRNLKYILKRVAARYLPRELIERKKQGFGFPLALWMRSELSGFLRGLFAESRFVEAGLFDRAYMDRILEEHLSGRVDHNFRLWILINLEIWHRLYFEGETVDSLRAFTDRLLGGAAPAGGGR